MFTTKGWSQFANWNNKPEHEGGQVIVGRFYCQANLHMDGNLTRVFTAGRTYDAVNISEDSMELIDDKNQRHIITHDWIKHFEKQ